MQLSISYWEASMDWNVAVAVKHIQENKATTPQYRCAKYVREAIEKGGIELKRPNERWPGEGPSACDYGSSLEQAGFEVFYDNTSENLQCGAYHPIKGDIAIFMPIEAEQANGINIKRRKHGHIQMYDGVQWISDHAQRQFFAGSDYEKKWGRFRIYRFTNLMCKSSGLKVDWSR